MHLQLDSYILLDFISYHFKLLYYRLHHLFSKLNILIIMSKAIQEILVFSVYLYKKYYILKIINMLF